MNGFCARHLMVFGVLAVCGLLAGCKTQVAIPVYMTDVAEVAETGKPMDAEVQIWVPVPSKDRCEEYTPKVIPALQRGFRTVTPAGCGKEGFDDYLKVKVSSSVVRSENGSIGPDGIRDVMAIAVQKDTLDGKDAYFVWLAQRFDDMKAMVKGAEAEFNQKLGDLEIRVEFQNDGRETVTANVASIFADGQPVLGVRKVEVQRRATLALVLSDVAVAAFRQGAGVEALWIEKPAGSN